MTSSSRPRWRRWFGLAATSALALLVFDAGPAARAETAATGAAEAARQVIDTGPYQRAFPGETEVRVRRERRSGGTPKWRAPSGVTPSRAASDGASGTLTAVAVVLGAFIAIGLLLALWARARAAWQKRQRPATQTTEPATPSATPALSSVDRLLQEARTHLLAGEGREAVVFLWRHAVAILSQAARRDPRGDEDLTGREVVRVLVSGNATHSAHLDALRVLLREMERAWFGRVPVNDARFCVCETAFRAVFEPQPAKGGGPA